MASKSRNVVGASTYQNIKRDIIFGHLAPGSKLKLAGLRTQYQASMSTLRETLNRIASEVDLSRFCAAPVAHLSGLSFECQGAFPAEWTCRVLVPPHVLV